MNTKIYKFPENLAESEKITINLGFVDLGHIDLLVRDRIILIIHQNRLRFPAKAF